MIGFHQPLYKKCSVLPSTAETMLFDATSWLCNVLRKSLNETRHKCRLDMWITNQHSAAIVFCISEEFCVDTNATLLCVLRLK